LYKEDKMAMLYRIKAIGLGLGLRRYKLDIIMSSNFDIDKNKSLVMAKVTGELQRNWGNSYELISVKKLPGGL